MTTSPSPRATLAVVASATLLVLIAFTLPLIGLTETAASVGAGPAGQAWILSSMSLGLCVALLTSGAVADDFGRQKVFVAGALLLAVSSVGTAVATDTVLFVAARILQGVGGAALIACSLGLITQVFPPGPARNHATGVWGAALGAGIAVGPLVAGVASAVLSWRLSYVLLVVASAAFIPLGRRFLPADVVTASRRIDLVGVLLLAGGVSALLAGLVQGRTGLSPVPVGLVLAGIALVAAFILWEVRTRAPMIDVTLFRRPDFVAASVAGLTTGLGVIALMSFTGTFLHRAYGLPTWAAALCLLAWAGPSALTALAARRLAHVMSSRVQLGLGLLGVAAGQALLIGIRPGDSVLWLLPGLLLAGVASGVLNAGLGRAAVGSVPPHRAAMGSGANNTFRYLGSALGTTVVVLVATAPGPSTPDLFTGWAVAAVVTTGLSLLGALVVLGTGSSGRPVRA